MSVFNNYFENFQYGTKHIIDSLVKSGRVPFKSLLICGGLSKNSLFVQTHADVCTMPVLIPEESETVLVGAAILGAYAAHAYPSLEVRNIIFNFLIINIY